MKHIKSLTVCAAYLYFCGIEINVVQFLISCFSSSFSYLKVYILVLVLVLVI